MPNKTEDDELRSVALQNATSILQARHRAEKELVDAKNSLEEKTEELARSLAIVQATLESSADGILVTSAERKITAFNQKYAAMWKIPSGTMEAKDHAKILEITSRHFHDPFEFLSRIDEIFRTSPEKSFDLLKLLDGRVIERVSTVQVIGDRNVGRVWNFHDVTERRQAEIGLKNSHQLFSTIIDQSPLGIYLVDSGFRLTHVNPRARPVFGNIDLLIGSDFQKIIRTLWPPKIADDCLQRFRHTLDTGESYKVSGFEGDRADRDATEFYDWELHRIVLPDGKFGVVAYFNDISKHVLAQRALQESEAKVRATFTQAAVGFAVTDLEGNVEEVNQRYLDILGYSREEAEKLTFKEVTHPDDLALTEREIGRLMAGEIPHYSIEKRYLRKDRSIVWSLSTVTLLRDANGEPRHFLGVIEDISLRKEAEESLLEETRVLELLNRTGTAIAAKLDLQDLVQTVTDAGRELSDAEFGAFFYNVTNENGEALLLYTLSGAPREAFEKFGLPRHTPVFHPTFQGTAVVRSGDITKDLRYGTMPPHHGMPEGHLPVCSYLAVPVISRSGEVIGGLLFGHSKPDIFTERAERLIVGVASQAAIAIDNARLFEAAQKEIEDRKKIEDALRSAQEKLSLHAGRLEEQVEQRTAYLNESIRSLEGVCYTIAHDLRAPLRAVHGFTKALLEDYAPAFDEDGKQLARRIVAAATRMDVLIRDLLEYAKLSHQDLPSENVDLNLCLKRVIDNLQGDLDAKKGKIVIQNLPTVWGNATIIDQIFGNLIGNFLKFTKEGRPPRIEIGVEKRDGGERIFVQDNGIGIALEHHDRVFEIFQRLHDNEKCYTGTGVGLAIVRNGIERIHGAISINPGINDGTCFQLDFQPKQAS